MLLNLLFLTADLKHGVPFCSWIQDIEAYTPGSKVDYPIIADPKREVAVL